MTTEQPPTEAVLTPRQAGRLLGVSPRTLARYADDGKLRVQWLPSGQRRYVRADVDRMIAAAQYPPPF